MVLLPTDSVEVWSLTPVEDEHGWAAETVRALVWSGLGAVQEVVPAASTQAGEAGGEGPLSPRHARTAAVYLPPESGVLAGHLLAARGVEWLVLRVRLVADPGAVGLDCYVVDAVEREAVI